MGLILPVILPVIRHGPCSMESRNSQPQRPSVMHSALLARSRGVCDPLLAARERPSLSSPLLPFTCDWTRGSLVCTAVGPSGRGGESSDDDRPRSSWSGRSGAGGRSRGRGSGGRGTGGRRGRSEVGAGVLVVHAPCRACPSARRCPPRPGAHLHVLRHGAACGLGLLPVPG